MKSVATLSADLVLKLQSVLLCNVLQGGEGLGGTGLAASQINVIHSWNYSLKEFKCEP